MLCKVLALALLALGVSADTPDARKARQLDLGPSTNDVAEPQRPSAAADAAARGSTFQQPGYLPPIEPAGAQNDPVVLVPTPAPEGSHGYKDICSDPFHSFLCATLKPRRPITGGLPGSSNDVPLTGANTFLEPSKVLAPPLNDLEDPPTTTTRRPVSTTYRPAPTTTRAPPTTVYRPAPTTPRPTTTTTTTTTQRPIVPAASSDSRTYLPPESIAPAAASPDIAVVRPDPAEEHHHHPHHHGRDLCSDPFHSFLCTPLKPRKRITGDIPNGLQGQNSFLAPKRVLPEPDISPQPSNEIDRSYLPPSTTRSPPPPPTTTRRPPPPPPTTTARPIQAQPSNEIDRAYLPPSTTRRPPPPPPTTTRRPPPPPPTTTRRPPPTTTQRPVTIRFRPEPSNEIERAYLPPVTTTTTQRPIEPQPSNEIDRAYLPPIAPQPTNVDNTYLPPDPVIEPAAAQDSPAIAAPDHAHDHGHGHGSHGFKDICSDPFHSFLCQVPKPRTRITGALPAGLRINVISPAPSNVDETRVRVTPKPSSLRLVIPDSPAPQPTQQKETVVPQPSNEVVGYDYPKPSAPLPLPTQGYEYPQPDNKLTLPSEVNSVVTGYDYPKPSPTTPRPTTPRPTTQRPTTPRPTTPRPTTPRPTTTVGYSYPKPDNKLTLPSEVNQVVTGYDYPKPSPTTPRPTTPRPTTPRPTTPRPTTPRPTTTVGYSYPKPENKLTLPSEVRPQVVTGYDYPKPSPTTPRPTTRRPTTPRRTTPRPTTTTAGYDYPTPQKRLNLPSESKQSIGYDYPKPSVGLPLPTQGYDYPKPDSRLTLPSEQRNSRRPSQARPSYNSPSYSSPSYDSPVASRNALPASLKEARERLQAGAKVAQISNISNQNEFSDLIPVNQVEFPESGALGVRFGDRLKRRQRQSYLLPPPGSHRL